MGHALGLFLYAFAILAVVMLIASLRNFQKFRTTLLDGRRVTGRRNPGGWHVHVYSPGARLVGYAVAATRPAALQAAGLSGGTAGEVLGRIGI